MDVAKPAGVADGSKHTWVRDRVVALADTLGPGAKLPPERALSEEYGIARETLRRSMDALVREGIVERRRGAGTFVAQERVTKRFSPVLSFTEDMRQRGMVASSRVVSCREGPAGARAAKYLGLSPAEPVLRVQRVRLADGLPMALETLHTPRALVPDLQGEDLADSSFYETLRERYGVQVAATRQTIEATVTDEAESELLGVPNVTPALFIARVTQTADGRTVEYVRSIFRGDRYRLEVDSATASFGGAL